VEQLAVQMMRVTVIAQVEPHHRKAALEQSSRER